MMGLAEFLVIVALVLLFLGAKRLPDLARSLGESIRTFRDSLRGAERRSRSGSSQKEA